MSSGKKYGLLLPEKNFQKKPVFQATRNVFGSDSESDDDAKQKPVLLKPSGNINRQAKITQEKAVMEDPTVYQYDEIYDSMITKKEEAKSKTKEDKKPKYIENLLKSATKRKIENERRLERQIQKEREEEGDEFADKEVFVTSAYKKKLEEMRQQEEEEKREEYLESIGDVTKQKDLGGFYRHLYEQKLGSDKKVETKEPLVKKENKDTQHDDATKSESKEKQPEKDKLIKTRNYRKRKPSNDQADLSDGEIEDSDEEINYFNLEDIRNAKKAKQNEENIDADSDFSIDDSSDEENDGKNKQKKSEDNSKEFKKPEAPVQQKSVEDDKLIEKSKPKAEPVEDIKDAVKPKIDIWKKRTVGDVFDQALKRYYERKAARSL